jgi:hypothetical protein
MRIIPDDAECITIENHPHRNPSQVPFEAYPKHNTIEISHDDWCEIYNGYDTWRENLTSEQFEKLIDNGRYDFSQYLRELLILAGETKCE